MGFWSFLFSKKTGDASENYVERPYYFKPNPSGVIGLCSQGTSSDLTPLQEGFITQLENNYSLLIEAIRPSIEGEFRNWKPEFKILNFEQEFYPSYLIIPACDQQPVEWEISFETMHDPNHTIFITMVGNQPLHIHIDG